MLREWVEKQDKKTWFVVRDFGQSRGKRCENMCQNSPIIPLGSSVGAWRIRTNYPACERFAMVLSRVVHPVPEYAGDISARALSPPK